MTKREFLVHNRDRLRLDRAVVLEEPVTAALADRVITRLLDLEAASARDAIYLFIASPGGDLKAALGIYEAMRFTTCDVVTVGMGDTASCAALLLAAGAPGRRIALSTARVSIHPPRSEPPAASDREQLEQMRRLNTLVFRILAFHTDHSPAQVEADARLERTFTAAQARAYGIVDVVDGLTTLGDNETISSAGWDAVSE